MAESTCLHIQDRDAGTIRIVEVPWISARIGRAAFCEVRLSDPSLPEEACRLHRRGRTWLLTPARGCDVVLDGEAVVGSRALGHDVDFRIGSFRLTLKRGKFAEPDWDRPADAPPRPPAVEPAAPPRSNPWEARWREAGDRLKAARDVEPPAAAQPPPIERPSPRETPRPAAAPTVERTRPRETPRPAAAPRYEPPPRPRPTAATYRPRAYVRPSPPSTKRPDPPRSLAPEAWTRPVAAPAPPVAGPPAPIPPPVDPPARRFHFLDSETIARLEAPDVAEALQPAPQPSTPPVVRRRLRRAVVDRRAGREDSPIADEDRATPSPEGFEKSPLPPGEGTAAAAAASDDEPHARSETPRPSPGPSGHPLPAGEGTPIAAQASDDEPRAPAAGWTYSGGPFVADTSVYGFGGGPLVPDATRTRDFEEDAAEFDPTRTRRSKPKGKGEDEWSLPSAREVLDGGLRRAQARTEAIPRPPSRPSAATPTAAVAPGQWSPPAWLAAPPALALTLAAGGLLAFCSWRQAAVSHDAAAVVQVSAAVRLAGSAAKDRPLPAALVPPKSSWWGAAPAHLAQWGVYLNGTKVEHGLHATAAGMYEAAAAAGPLDPTAKFNLARLRGDQAPAIGLSRDAAALAWTGRTLHRAGKDAEALRAFRRALEIAATAEPPRERPLAYSEDPDVPRYLLPGEELAAVVVAELVGDASWSFRDWSEAVPETGVAALAVARALRRDHRSDSDAVLRGILKRAEADAKTQAGDPDEPQGDPDERAVTLAVAAEATAMRADWKAAAGRYRAAIDQVAAPRIRRSWWFNLADVALRGHDDDQRRAALDEALASTSPDEVSRRVLELRQGPAAPAAGRLRSNGTKAN